MVRTAAADRLRALLPEEISGYVVDRQMVLDTLIYAAAERKSLHSACASLSGTANDDTIRNYLNAAFRPEWIHRMQLAVNRALRAELPRRLRRGRWHIAIDLHDQPYYGHCEELEPWVCQSKSKRSTKRFLRIATAYVIRDGLRVTAAMRVVRPEHNMEDVVSWLVQALRSDGIGIRRLWLDRGFASGGVVRRIEAMRLSAIIACPIRGKQGGTRALCKGRRTYGTVHDFSSRRHGSWSAYVSVVRAFVTKKGRKRARWLLFIQVGVRIPDKQVKGLYRRRFGIESSYRLMNQVRARTTSRNPAIRYLLMAVGLILVNVWVQLRYAHCRFVKRKRECLDEARFRLWRLIDFIRHAVERRYGVVTAIDSLGRPVFP